MSTRPPKVGTEPLPIFRYHPDPIASGSIVASKKTCACCNRARGHIYALAVYAEEDLDNRLCPWCIADGSAHEQFDATFTDSEAFDADIPAAAADEIITRTPGFAAWGNERWIACCNDAAAFLEPAGIAEIRTKYRELEGRLMSVIVHELGISGSAATRLLESLSRDQGPTAYVFRCRACESLHAYIDGPGIPAVGEPRAGEDPQ